MSTVWSNEIKEELSLIEDFNEIFQNSNEDNFNFSCEEMGLTYLFNLLNSQNTTTLRNTMINQVQGSGISTEQQKKTCLINWYFANDPMGSIYLATRRNPALVASYHPDSNRDPGMLYGENGAAVPIAIGMETYFIKIKTHFGQSMFDQLVTEFAQQSNLYVDEIKVDELCPTTGGWHLYGSSRLGVYEANRLISKRVARDLNLDNQITTNEYVIETPEEVTYLFSSYQLERGAKRYELANHLGNVLTVISDKKTAICTGNTFSYFAAERISATDYSPFGAPLAGRGWNGGEYRFGFGGMEITNEVNGNSNEYTTMFRQFDPRLCRWTSIDPKIHPWESPFVSMGNNPIVYNDIFGDEIKNGYEKKLNSQKEKVNGLKDQLSKFGDKEKKSREYRKLESKLQNEEEILGGIQEQYDDIQKAIKDLEDCSNNEFNMLNSLTDARGAAVDVIIIEESLLKSNFFTEGVNKFTGEPFDVQGLTEIIPVDCNRYYFDKKGKMIEYVEIGSSNGPNTVKIVINAQSPDKGAVLAHEWGHALYDVPKMLELLEWYRLNPGVSVGGHGGKIRAERKQKNKKIFII